MGLDYWLVRLCVFLSTRLPLRLCYTLAEVVADVSYVLCPRLRDDTKSNIARVLELPKSSREVSKVTRRCMRNYAKYVVELCWYSGRPAKSEAKVLFEGLDRLDAALSEGKGVIIAGLHLGSWYLGATFLSQHHYPFNAIVSSSYSNKKLNRFMHNLRCKAGIGVISAQDGIMPAVEVLRHNELLTLLIDAPTKGKLVKVGFLGGYAQFSAVAAVLALRTKAAVLPGCIVRLPDNTFRGFIGEKVEFRFGGDLRSNTQSFTQSILDSLQGFLKQYPDQWGMRYNIWCE